MTNRSLELNESLENKVDEHRVIARNKARLIGQSFNQEEGIDYEETFTPIAKLESIRMILAYTCYKDFILYQVDIKSSFQNGYILEEIYVAQPPGFENHKYPNHVYKLKNKLLELGMKN